VTSGPDPILITGAAGFIGFCFARRLLEAGRAVVGVDSVNDYYDPALRALSAALGTVRTRRPGPGRLAVTL
jgi:nucleoside-diphosphate-sugar epimerase